MPRSHQLLLALAFLALGIACLVIIGGCGRQEKALSTGKVMTSTEVRATLPGYVGDTAYAVVRSTALPSLYDNFQTGLSREGLIKWDARFDCNHFAALYVALAQARYAVAAWQSSTPAQSLALAEVWYHRDDGKGHAIVAAITEHGLQFIEPQTGAVITPSESERSNIYFCRW